VKTWTPAGMAKREHLPPLENVYVSYNNFAQLASITTFWFAQKQPKSLLNTRFTGSKYTYR